MGILCHQWEGALALTALVRRLESVHMNKWAPYVVDSYFLQFQQSQLIWVHQFYTGLLGAMRWSLILTTQSTRRLCAYKARDKVTTNLNLQARLACDLRCIFLKPDKLIHFKKWTGSNHFATQCLIIGIVNMVRNRKRSWKVSVQNELRNWFTKREWEMVLTKCVCAVRRGGDKFPDPVCNLTLPAYFHGPKQLYNFSPEAAESPSAVGQWPNPLKLRFAFGKLLILLHRRRKSCIQM